MGMIFPGLLRRRGREGLYDESRALLKAIPGATFTEGIRVRENTFCCGGGRGAKEAFPDYARVSCNQKLKEVKAVGAEVVVSACPWCKSNFSQVIKENGDEVQALDITEIIAKAI